MIEERGSSSVGMPRHPWAYFFEDAVQMQKMPTDGEACPRMNTLRSRTYVRANEKAQHQKLEARYPAPTGASAPAADSINLTGD
jgi:hypothetical protein